MSEEKFTQGEWEVVNGTDVYTGLGVTNSQGRTAIDSDGWHVASCTGVAQTFTDYGTDYLPLKEVKANASLISAAPDMYREAKGLLGYVMDKYGLKDESELTCPHMIGLAKSLAKARGEL